MKVVNREELVCNAVHEADGRARRSVLRIIEACLEAIDPRKIVRSQLVLVGDQLTVAGKVSLNLSSFNKVFVIGGGKACGAMAEALEEVLGKYIYTGHVNIVYGAKSLFKTERIVLHEASHPIPDERGVEGSERIMKLAEEAEEGDLVICLISGGGSALMPLPVKDVSLDEMRKLTDMLLKSGASINEINVVRKHLSRLKGGWLAKKVYPATLLSLIISDVVGDPLDSIASGPTAPDPSTYEDAVKILKKYSLWDKAPRGVRKHLSAGLRGLLPETPKPGDEAFKNVFNIIIGNNRTAALAAFKEAEALGFNTILLSTFIEGEARHVGKVLASIGRELAASNMPIKRPCAIIAGGETTVTITGRGIGGRNQELVLSASITMQGLKGVSLASIGTDGIDGPTNSAGAIADGSTVARARKLGMDAEKFLLDNDSHSFFKKLGDAIITGPTGSNVNDLAVLIAI